MSRCGTTRLRAGHRPDAAAHAHGLRSPDAIAHARRPARRAQPLRRTRARDLANARATNHRHRAWLANANARATHHRAWPHVPNASGTCHMHQSLWCTRAQDLANACVTDHRHRMWLANANACATHHRHRAWLHVSNASGTCHMHNAIAHARRLARRAQSLWRMRAQGLANARVTNHRHRVRLANANARATRHRHRLWLHVSNVSGTCHMPRMMLRLLTSLLQQPICTRHERSRLARARNWLAPSGLANVRITHHRHRWWLYASNASGICHLHRMLLQLLPLLLQQHICTRRERSRFAATSHNAISDWRLGPTNIRVTCHRHGLLQHAAAASVQLDAIIEEANLRMVLQTGT